MAALMAATKLRVPRGQTATLRFVYGYVYAGSDASGGPPSGSELTAAIAPLVAKASNVFSTASTAAAAATPDADAKAAAGSSLAGVVRRMWAPLLTHVSLPDNATAGASAALADEVAWHSYVLQAAPSFDSYFGEHIIDQGTAYRYSAGFQGAVRDPLQHAMPLTTSRPDLVRSVLRYTLKSQQRDPLSPAGGPSGGGGPEPVGLPDSMLGGGVVRPGNGNCRGGLDIEPQARTSLKHGVVLTSPEAQRSILASF